MVFYYLSESFGIKFYKFLVKMLEPGSGEAKLVLRGLAFIVIKSDISIIVLYS